MKFGVDSDHIFEMGRRTQRGGWDADTHPQAIYNAIGDIAENAGSPDVSAEAPSCQTRMRRLAREAIDRISDLGNRTGVAADQYEQSERSSAPGLTAK